MAVRIKDGMIPYTGGQGIEITNNHVINVLLRELNNLIEVNEDRELYVDLQLPDGIQPEDDFPVGVTTGKILQEDGWDDSGIILNWKTTSGDYVRFIYANDGKLYYDPGTGTWIEIGAGGGGVQINVATASTLGLIKLGSDTQQVQAPVTATSISGRTYPVQLNADNQAVVNIPWENTTYTAGTNITIDQNNEISATIPSALIYKGNVNDLSDLPASGTVGDTYFVEGEDGMYSWDGTQWNYVGGTGIDVSNLFNKTIDDSDDIVQGSTHLFCSPSEKNYWNGKQDELTEGDGIDITNDVVSNTKPFDPQNGGSLGQVLKKTSTGYRWAEESGGGGGTTYTAGDGIDITNRVISNTKPFEPGTGTVGQVLTKTANGYDWETLATGEGNVKLFTLTNDTDYTNAQAVADWMKAGKLAIIKVNATFGNTQKTGDYYFYPVQEATSSDNSWIFHTIPTANDYVVQYGVTRHKYPTITFAIDNNGTVTNISITDTVNSREDGQWTGTAAEYWDLVTGGHTIQGVVYNIIPNS